LIPIDELHTFVGQDGVDRLGHCLDEHLEKRGSRQLGRSAIDTGEDQLRGSVDRNQEEAFPALILQLGDVDVEISDLVALELLGLHAVGLGQAADAMTLQTAV